MNPLPRHYQQLVGLNQHWVIADVQLDMRSADNCGSVGREAQPVLYPV